MYILLFFNKNNFLKYTLIYIYIYFIKKKLFFLILNLTLSNKKYSCDYRALYFMEIDQLLAELCNFSKMSTISRLWNILQIFSTELQNSRLTAISAPYHLGPLTSKG